MGLLHGGLSYHSMDMRARISGRPSYDLVEVMTLVRTPPDRRSVVVRSASYYTTHCGLTVSWVFRLVDIFQQKGVN